MKNLLLIHLESLNYINYRLNHNMFPALYELENQGLFFDHYYSTATSTLMVIADLLYGGTEQYEQCDSLDYIPKEYYYKSSLFDDLKALGYYTGLYVHPDGGDRISAEERHIAGFHNEMILKRDLEEFINVLEEGMTHEPFALMACNYISNLSFNQYADFSNYDLNVNAWEIGYRSLDHFIEKLISLLNKKNLWDSTMIVLYGDHGDDYWTHGFHQGLTHSIEPYELLIHMPLIVLDSSIKEASKNNKLIATTDLRELIYNVIVKDENLNNVIPENSFVVSRNEYAAQSLRSESFNKSYCVTDGRFLLLVSSTGLEMYDVWMDHSCHNNFLRFFLLRENILFENDDLMQKLTFHMSNFMSKRTQRILRQTFYSLWNKLYKGTLALYEAGKLSKVQMESEMDFYHINYGIEH